VTDADAGAGDALDVEVAMAGLRAEMNDVHQLLRVLVKSLVESLGERVKVERKGGLLRKSEEIKSVEVEIGHDVFRADPHGSGVDCSVGHSSGGIRIRSEQVPLEEWIERLLRALQTEAAHSQTARLALERIVIGDA
jgi:hypothetical protein